MSISSSIAILLNEINQTTDITFNNKPEASFKTTELINPFRLTLNDDKGSTIDELLVSYEKIVDCSKTKRKVTMFHET